jgi:hypothetical protein
MEQQRHADNAKIDKLVAQMTHLSTMVSTMAASQSQIQKEFLTLKQQMRDRDSQGPQGSPAYAHSRASGGSHNAAPAVHPGRDLLAYDQQRSTSQERQQPPQHIGFQGAGGSSSRDRAEHDPLVETIDRLMEKGSFDEAMMHWLQSGNRQEEIFQQVLVKYNPSFVSELQPLLLLSVGATVSADLDGPNVAQKLALTEVVIYSFNRMVHNLVSSRPCSLMI